MSNNKINIKLLQILFLFIFSFILPNITYADNLYGGTCGTLTCGQNEVCQKQYRGVLPISGQNDGNATYTCVRPEAIEAPESPYKGSPGCSDGTAGGLLNSTVNRVLGGTLNTSLNNIAGDFLGNLTSPFGIKLDGTLTGILNDPIGQFTGNFNDLIGLGEIFEDCNYNNIDGVIDTRRLVAPLPVDLFNPLPLPVNVTSPTPLPVVVVDDLALYQQKELIDAPLAAQQKAATIATVSATLRTQVTEQNLLVKNYFDIKRKSIQDGALDSETGVIAKDAIETYGYYANFSTDKNDQLARYFRDLQDPTKSQLPRETFTEKCGNIKLEEVNTLECIIEGLKTPNNPNDIADMTAYLAARKSDEAYDLLIEEVRAGDGYKALSEGDNTFTKIIQTPGSNIASLSQKVNEATMDQAIVASGDNCFEAIPNNIIEGSLKPILTDGLYDIKYTLTSEVDNVTSDPLNAVQNPQGIADSVQSGIIGALPDPNNILQTLQDSLVKNVTSGLSCEFNKQISGLLNGIIGNLSLPGIGNVSAVITDAVTGAATDAVTQAARRLIP